MSYRMEGSGTIVIEAEPDTECELCGAEEETRPYGPGGKRVCFKCGEKTPDIVKHNLRARLFGEGKII